MGFAGVADAVLPTSGLVVLAYHRVGGEGHQQMDLPLDRFRDQMARAGRQPPGAEPGRRRSPSIAAEPYRAGSRVVLTFDDGTADFAEHVLACSTSSSFRPPCTWQPSRC
jgi:peptidoglycan/xylan/chitin deacetylase (PgdA/CDA1 family)